MRFFVGGEDRSCFLRLDEPHRGRCVPAAADPHSLDTVRLQVAVPVSTRTGAVPDTVPQDAGLLVPVNDAAAFADALRCMLTDPKMRDRFAKAAATAGAALPDWDRTAWIAGQVIDGI